MSETEIIIGGGGMEALGIWKLMEPRAEPIRDILVTDAALGGAPSPFSLHFDSREIGMPMGHIVENRHIRSALYDVADTLPNLRLISPCGVTTLKRTGATIEATLSNGNSVRAKL